MVGSGDRAKLTQQFDEAMRSRDRNEPSEAVRLLQEVVADPTASRRMLSAAFCQLGHISDTMLRDVPAVAGYFSRAVEADPTDELSSLGLYHAFVETNQRTTALEEAERYLSLADSVEYRELFFDGYADGFEPSAREIFARIHALLAKEPAKSPSP